MTGNSINNIRIQQSSNFFSNSAGPSQPHYRFHHGIVMGSTNYNNTPVLYQNNTSNGAQFYKELLAPKSTSSVPNALWFVKTSHRFLLCFNVIYILPVTCFFTVLIRCFRYICRKEMPIAAEIGDQRNIFPLGFSNSTDETTMVAPNFNPSCFKDFFSNGQVINLFLVFSLLTFDNEECKWF